MTTESIRTLRRGTCPSLTGKSTLTFEVGVDEASSIHIRVTKNTGGGMFNRSWVGLEEVHRLVDDRPITSGTLAPLFRGGSANSAGFLLAVMRHEGLVRKGKSRAYKRLDGRDFFSGAQALLGGSAMGVAKAARKAAKAGQPGGKAGAAKPTAPGTAPSPAPETKRPAVYVAEVNGPLQPAAKKKRQS